MRPPRGGFFNRKYEDLKVWQKGFNFVKVIYQESKNFPTDERFGLISQIRRSAVSIPSNINDYYFIKYLTENI